MPTLLHISVSPRGSYSISRRLSDAAVDAWKAGHPGGRVIERDLAKTQLTFVDLDWIQGAFSPPEQHNENHKRAIALSDELVAELVAADEIILGAPMYNFAIPAALKAWIDHVVRAGKTFRYTSSGPEGLLAGKNKKVLAIIASGGSYVEGSGFSALDYEVPYLRFIFSFMGITDIQFIQAGGTGSVAPGSGLSRGVPCTLSERNPRSDRRHKLASSAVELFAGRDIASYSTSKGDKPCPTGYRHY